MVELPPVTQAGLSWTLEWIDASLSGESAVVKAEEVRRLHRDLAVRSTSQTLVGAEAAIAAASVAVQIFELLVERDPQAAGQYVSGLRRRLADLQAQVRAD